MTERELEKKCHEVLRAKLAPMPLLWHIHDETTGGQPDTEVVWNGHTTKIEFKKLKTEEELHKKWEDGRQLVTLVQYERASMGRAWVVAYIKDFGTRIYRPTKLLNKEIPAAARGQKYQSFRGQVESLWNYGCMEMPGEFYLGHCMVAELIRETHK